MGIRKTSILLITFILFGLSCTTNQKNANKLPNSQLAFADKQLSLLLETANEANRNPRTITEDGKMHWTNKNFDWTEGFFPGTCWYLYESTKDEKWKVAAEKFQAQFKGHKKYTFNHDLGFVFSSSYGNGYRLTKNNDFKEVLITAANSLLTRFNPTIGCLKSWDVTNGWQAERGWQFPVIIDNMMNLELLYEASILTNDAKYKDAATTHAKTTLKNHFRADNSSFHVVDYDPETGKVRSKQTAQGFTDSSSWARGQAWGLYGFTLCYRYTKNETFLKQAQKVADFIINYKGTPEDGIPYWDYNAPNIPNEPRDASAAAVTASALIELNDYTNGKYKPAVKKILTSLSSNVYTANLSENHNFLLKHSVGSIPHNNEIDVPLNYADYYYIEALLRYQEYNKK